MILLHSIFLDMILSNTFNIAGVDDTIIHVHKKSHNWMCGMLNNSWQKLIQNCPPKEFEKKKNASKLTN